MEVTLKFRMLRPYLFFASKSQDIHLQTIPVKLQQKLAFVASVGDVPDVARYVVSFGVTGVLILAFSWQGKNVPSY